MKLNPCPFCPFCGAKELFLRTTDMFWPARLPNDPPKEEDFVVWVHCIRCECDGPKVDICDNVGWSTKQLKREAVRRWNQRHDGEHL